LTNLINVAGEFLKPKGVLLNSKGPSFARKAVNGLLVYSTGTREKLFSRSSVEKNVAACNFYNTSSINDAGKRSVNTMWFSLL